MLIDVENSSKKTKKKERKNRPNKKQTHQKDKRHHQKASPLAHRAMGEGGWGGEGQQEGKGST